jgi:thiol:disulfide interchange protein DsbA
MQPIYALMRTLLPLAVTLLAALSLAAPASAQQLQEGKQFVRLKNPVPVETGNKIEVIEFFSYGCPHCADLEPILEDWMKRLPPDVQFRRVPVLFQPKWVTLAKVYYTLEALGVEPKMTSAIDGTQISTRNSITGQLRSEWCRTQSPSGSRSLTCPVGRC